MNGPNEPSGQGVTVTQKKKKKPHVRPAKASPLVDVRAWKYHESDGPPIEARALAHISHIWGAYPKKKYGFGNPYTSTSDSLQGGRQKCIGKLTKKKTHKKKTKTYIYMCDVVARRMMIYFFCCFSFQIDIRLYFSLTTHNVIPEAICWIRIVQMRPDCVYYYCDDTNSPVFFSYNFFFLLLLDLLVGLNSFLTDTTQWDTIGHNRVSGRTWKADQFGCFSFCPISADTQFTD